jgi:hypothetical protein
MAGTRSSVIIGPHVNLQFYTDTAERLTCETKSRILGQTLTWAPVQIGHGLYQCNHADQPVAWAEVVMPLLVLLLIALIFPKRRRRHA